MASQSASKDVIVLSDSDDSLPSIELEYVPLMQRLKPDQPVTITTTCQNDLITSNSRQSSQRTRHTFSDSDDDDGFDLPVLDVFNKISESQVGLPSVKSPIKKHRNADSNNDKRLERDSLKLLKEADKERQKKLKEAEKEMQKINKPGECLKTIRAIIDLNLLEMKGASDLLNIFQTENLDYSLEQQPLKNCVTWERELVEDAVVYSSTVELKKKVHLEDCALVVIESSDFVIQVDAEIKQGFEEVQPDEESLWAFVKHIKRIFPEMRATFLIYGMDQYYKKNKSKERKNYRVNVLGETSPPKRKRNTKKTEQPFISRLDVEEAITKVQLLEAVNFRSVETIGEIGEIIFMFTKSMAEKYLRKNKDQDDDFDSYLLDGMFAVKVDKDGKGLIKAWEQQLMTFHQVSSDIAQAIISKYPSPVSLLKAYENCHSQSQQEHMLENIEVRRGFGPLNTTRRVGPELSNKVYHFLTSMSGDTALYQ